MNMYTSKTWPPTHRELDRMLNASDIYLLMVVAITNDNELIEVRTSARCHSTPVWIPLVSEECSRRLKIPTERFGRNPLAAGENTGEQDGQNPVIDMISKPQCYFRYRNNQEVWMRPGHVTRASVVAGLLYTRAKGVLISFQLVLNLKSLKGI